MTFWIAPTALLALAIGSVPVSAQDKPAEPTAPLMQVLEPRGVEEVLLDTTFRFAADFNSRPVDRRKGARIVGAAESFFRAMTPEINPVQGPVVREAAREHLRVRFQNFLDGYVGLLIEQGVRDIELRKSESIDQYLSMAAMNKRCNQIPCQQPPCCKDCSAPACRP